MGALMAVLAPGVTLYADSGGFVRAPRRPIVGADRVARFFLGVWNTSYAEWVGVPEAPPVQIHLVQINDGPGLLGTVGGNPVTALTLDASNGIIQSISLVANPNKLTGLRAISY
jgi:RNA polymerase sigma-70 factor (ECF subfamily)